MQRLVPGGFDKQLQILNPIHVWGAGQGRTRGPRPPPPPSTRAPPERLKGGTHGGGSFIITSAYISLPQARHSGVPRGAVVLLPPLGVPGGALPPWKIQN